MVANALSRRRHELSTVTLEVDLRTHILSALPANTWYQEVSSEIASSRALEGRYTG